MANVLLEAARIAEAAFGIPLVAPGQAYTTRVTWKNTGGESYAFDFMTAYGSYDPGTNTFTPYRYAFVKENVSSSPGQTQTTDIPCGVEADTPPGKYDCFVLIGDLRIIGSTVTIEKQYDVMVKENLLEVGKAAVAAEITGFEIVT